MSFEPNYEKVVSNYKRKIGEMQSQLVCKLPTNDGIDVAKILCTNVKINMLNSSVMQSTINFDGVALVQAVYIDQDNNVKFVDYSLEFKDKFVANKELMVADTIISYDVVEIRSQIEGNNIKVEAILNVCIDGIFADNLNILTSATGEGVYSKLEDINFSSFVGVASDRFDVSNDIEINDAVEEILFVCPNATVDRVESYDNYVKVFGTVAVNIAYTTAGDNSTIRTLDTNFDYEQELALTGTKSASVADCQASCMYQGISVTTNLGMDKSVISLSVPIDAKCFVWNDESIQIVSDIYSLTNNLNISTESYTVQSIEDSMRFSERVVGSVTIDDNDMLIDDVLGVCCGDILIASHRVQDNTLIVDGVLNATVIYRNNEVQKISSILVQVPFSLDMSSANLNDEMLLRVVANIKRLQVKGRRGTEIEVVADIEVCVHACSLDKDAVVSQVTVEDEKLPSKSNLTIYIAREGDTIWDIAKQMSVPEDVIIEQNLNLELPIKNGERIVVYKQVVAQI